MSIFGSGDAVTTTFVGRDNLSPVVRGIRRTMDTFKRDAIGGFGLAAGFSVWGLAIQGFHAVTSALGDAVHNAVVEEASVSKLTTALEANIDATEAERVAIEGVIQSRTRLGFSDDEQRDSLAKLVAVTKDANQALAVQAIAMDFARLKGVDLGTASEILGKVWGGNVGILTRYGIQLAKGTSGTQALAAVQAMAANQATAWANTSEGAFTTLQIELG